MEENDIIGIINSFVHVQTKLIDAINRLTSLTEEGGNALVLDKSGEVNVGDEKWIFKRHGMGLSFRRDSDGKVVDVHRGIERPLAFDAWRLVQYLKSSKISQVKFEGKSYESSSNRITIPLKEDS